MVDAISCSVPPAHTGPLFEAAGCAGPGLTVRIPDPMAAWPSGFVMVTFFGPEEAAVVSRVRVRWVGSVKVTPVTVTPPETVDVMRLAKPGPPGSEPGSKNPDPEAEVPVIATLTEGSPAQTPEGAAPDGEAGGGASSWTTRTAQLFMGLSAYSCTVHTVLPSLGSTSVKG